MSVKVVVSITVIDEEYEAGTEAREAFSINGWAASTGKFATLHQEIIKNLVDGAVSQAERKAAEKLQTLKGSLAAPNNLKESDI